MLSNTPRHFLQDAINFRHFLIQQANEFIVLLDRLKRFHKNCLTTGTRSMDDTLHAPLLFNLDWNDKALATNRDELILNTSSFSQASQVTTQRFLDLLLLLLNASSDPGQFGRRPIVERAIRKNLVSKTAQEPGEIQNAFRKLPDRAPAVAHRARRFIDNSPPFCRSIRDQHDIAYLGRFQRSSRDTRLVQQIVNL